MKFLTRTLMVIFLMAIGVPFLSAQTVGKYRVMLTDKKKTTYSLNSPAEYLSEKAVARRLRLGLSVDSTDLPVCRKYLKRIRKHAEVLHTSRWNNTAVVRTSDSLAVEKIKLLPFVR
ncbi:MAG: serine protease, partial [Bacteroidaceae bacterium]|nr:serine protease [Bacteroidaceae bacterium]